MDISLVQSEALRGQEGRNRAMNRMGDAVLHEMASMLAQHLEDCEVRISLDQGNKRLRDLLDLVAVPVYGHLAQC